MLKHSVIPLAQRFQKDSDNSLLGYCDELNIQATANLVRWTTLGAEGTKDALSLLLSPPSKQPSKHFPLPPPSQCSNDSVVLADDDDDEVLFLLHLGGDDGALRFIFVLLSPPNA